MNLNTFSAGLLTAACLIIPAAKGAYAFELTDGAYETVQDGGTGMLKISAGQASLGVEGTRCAGKVTGRLLVFSDGSLSFTQRANGAECTLLLKESDYGMAKIMPGRGCAQFHGQTCSFFGVVKNASTP